jgi:hypothetical protein
MKQRQDALDAKLENINSQLSTIISQLSTNTPTVSPTPSPSISPSYIPVTMQISFEFQQGSCQTVGCTDRSTFDNITTRVWANPRRLEPIVTSADVLSCFVTPGSAIQGNNCVGAIPMSHLYKYSVDTDFNTYKAAAQIPPAVPTWYSTFRPAIYNASTYPNLGNAQAIAAIVNCTGQPQSQGFRFAWLRTQSGPCFFDTKYSAEICTSASTSDNNFLYVDSTNSVQPDNTVFVDALCP